MVSSVLLGQGEDLLTSDPLLEQAEKETLIVADAQKAQALSEKMAKLEQENRALAESLAAANAEAEEYLRASREMRARLEALGVESILEDRSLLEQRILKAANDHRFLSKENEQLSEKLLTLTEAAIAFQGASKEAKPQAAAGLEAALRDTDAALGLKARRAAEAPVAIDEAEVVSVKQELGLAILNAGRKSGVNVGMPFSIIRKDKPVGSGLVCDVRDGVSGLLVTQLIEEDDTVQVGDRIRLTAGNANF
jgi:predicted RNase H-like nuclease (RuvC/YqgF family)